MPGTSLVEPLEAGVIEQLKEEDSLLKFYQKALHIRLKNPEIARGEVTPIDLGDKNLGAYSSVYNATSFNSFIKIEK